MDLKAKREKLGELKALAIDIDGEPLNVKYRVQAVTPARLRQFAELQQQVSAVEKSGDQSQAAGLIVRGIDLKSTRFVETVAEWDLLDGGEPVPIASEELMAREDDGAFWQVVDAVLTAINEDQNPNPPSGAPSAAG